MITSRETFFALRTYSFIVDYFTKDDFFLSVSEFRSPAVQSGIFKSFPGGRVKRREIRKS